MQHEAIAGNKSNWAIRLIPKQDISSKERQSSQHPVLRQIKKPYSEANAAMTGSYSND